MNRIIWIPSAIPFFIFGFMYYLVSPYIALEFFGDIHPLTAAYDYMDISFFDLRYLLDSLLIIISWILGYTLIQTIKFNVSSSLDEILNFNTPSFLLGLSLILFLFFLVFNAISKGTVFFSGYSDYDISILGQLATILFTSVWFFNYFKRKNIKILFFIIFIISSLLMLGLGSRMFFVLGTVSLILALLSTKKRLIYNPFFYFVLILLSIMVIGIGIWRGETNFSWDLLASIFLAEPLFTSVSAPIYFENMGGRPIIALPTDIFASIINFIPTIIYPDKVELLKELTYDQHKFSPFGAHALMENIYSNFGIFFPIYFFSIGMFYGYIRQKALNSRFFLATYFSILPLLMFHFFREGFITVIKVLFFNALILPFILVVFMVLIFVKKYKI